MAQPHPLRVTVLTLGYLSLFGHLLVFATHLGWWDHAFAGLARLCAILLFASWFRKTDLDRKVPLHVYLLTITLLAANALRWSWAHYHPHLGSSRMFPGGEIALGTVLLGILLIHDRGVSISRKA